MTKSAHRKQKKREQIKYVQFYVQIRCYVILTSNLLN